MKTIAAVAGAVVVMAPAAVSAQSWEREVGWWTVGRNGDACAMTMEYDGPGATEVTLYSNGDGSDTLFVMVNSGWSIVDDKIYTLEFQFDEWTLTRATSGTSPGYKRGFMLFADEKFLEQFAASGSFQVKRDEAIAAHLNLKSSSAALAVMKRCQGELAADARAKAAEEKRWDYVTKDPFAEPPVTRAFPEITNFELVKTMIDYPAHALRLKEQGEVKVIVGVDTSGRASACVVSASSGSAALDKATCDGMLRWGRFLPATDTEGTKIGSSWTGGLRFTMPE